ncbi:hypothetical protein ACFVS2_25510 [Brevibacillus sp. NPDC058079]|uniref:hypothetical protein n=1 Tax=Brevibacillus sp. NPDC058079 TaxID=3346330 RepID=UPI0036E931E6
MKRFKAWMSKDGFEQGVVCCIFGIVLLILYGIAFLKFGIAAVPTGVFLEGQSLECCKVELRITIVGKCLIAFPVATALFLVLVRPVEKKKEE